MLHILHVEPSHFFQEATRQMVQSLGHQYTYVESTEDAFRVLDKQAVDVIITALELTEGSGEQFVYSINRSPYRSLPILVLTATDNMEMRRKLFEMGVVDYLIKDQFSEEHLERYFDTLEVDVNLMKQITTLKIAVVDDSHLTLKVIQNILEQQEITNVDYFDSSESLLETPLDFDLYIIDLVMPGVSGEDLVIQLRRHNPMAAIILVSAIGNYKTISNTLMSGADDYIIKPFDSTIFMARIRAHARSFLLRMELEEKNIQLRELAVTDGLTGLYNHRYIMGRLQEETSRSDRYGSDFSVILLDIDDFKVVNDTRGHPFGDTVLQNLANLITSSVRKSDIVGRYGGEEFLILLPEADAACAEIVGEKIRQSIALFDFGDGLHLTISGGIATMDTVTKAKLVQLADQGLYKAKHSGKNQLIAFQRE